MWRGLHSIMGPAVCGHCFSWQACMRTQGLCCAEHMIRPTQPRTPRLGTHLDRVAGVEHAIHSADHCRQSGRGGGCGCENRSARRRPEVPCKKDSELQAGGMLPTRELKGRRPEQAFAAHSLNHQLSIHYSTTERMAQYMHHSLMAPARFMGMLVKIPVNQIVMICGGQGSTVRAVGELCASMPPAPLLHCVLASTWAQAVIEKPTRGPLS